MAKKLKIYEKILLAMAFSADQLINFYQIGSSLRRRRFYFDPWLQNSYKLSSLRQTIYRMLKTGHIDKIIKNGKPYLSLTSQGKKKIQRDFPLWLMQKQKWDEKWRLVIFDISEKLRSSRDFLREKLKQLGFGMLQKSIYISPYDFTDDVYEFLQNRQLLGKAWVLTAKHQLMGDAQDLANLVWKIDKLEEEYELLWRDIIKIKEVKNKSKFAVEIKNKYFDLIEKDPLLPLELLPFNWIGERVKKEIFNGSLFIAK